MEPTLSPLTRRRRVAKRFTDPSLAKQSFLEETNINTIMAKFEQNGLLDHVNTHKGDYGNFIGYPDYQTALNQISEAEVAFATIPAKIRAMFNNSPLQFLEFAQNPDNLDQMIGMGLAPKREPLRAPGDPPVNPGTLSPAAPETPPPASSEAGETPPAA